MSSKILSYSAFNAFAGLAQLASGFVSSIVVARLLGAEGVGIVAFCLWMVTTGVSITDLGISIALRRFVPDVQATGAGAAGVRRFCAWLIRPLIASVLVFAGLHFALDLTGVYDEMWPGAGTIALIVGVVFIVYAIGAFQVSALISAKDYGPFIRLTLLSAPLQIIGVALGAAWFGIPGALLGYLPAYLLFFVMALRLVATRPDNFGIGHRRIIEYSLLSWVSYTIQVIFLQRAEFFFLGTFATHEAVGLYSAAMTLANLALQVPIQASGALIPYFSEQQLDVSSDRPPASLEGTMRALFLIALPLCFGLAAIAPELMPAVFGEPFRPAGEVLALLALTSPLFVFVAFGNQFLYATEQVRFVLMTALIGAAVISIGCVALVPMLGAWGAAVARALTYLVLAALLFRRAKLWRMSPVTRQALTKILFAAVLCGVAARLLLLSLHGWAGVIAGVGLGSAVFILAIRMLRALPEGDVDVLMTLCARLPRFAGMAVRFVGNRPLRVASGESA